MFHGIMSPMQQLNARQRRQMMKWHQSHGANVPATCAQFGVSRATLYRWLARHAAYPGEPLRAQSRRPHTKRAPTWSRGEFTLLCDLTMAHPTWGRGRLTAALTAQTGTSRSPATVGRMLARMRRRCPICHGREGRHDQGQHVLDKAILQIGLEMPLVPPPPDPEKTARHRETAAIVREAQALIRRPR
jgi:transposase